ncbi:MAG: hypothetical protein PHH54_02310 [Candidatus Nanoarchaeia archaeon]|nr:hypothetical protein [Candidatus Nanoarchaeia archaeon]MDD5740795.1 hypothetical protein [Candidatus Nanoarchaeia archaeon]
MGLMKISDYKRFRKIFQGKHTLIVNDNRQIYEPQANILNQLGVTDILIRKSIESGREEIEKNGDNFNLLILSYFLPETEKDSEYTSRLEERITNINRQLYEKIEIIHRTPEETRLSKERINLIKKRASRLRRYGAIELLESIKNPDKIPPVVYCPGGEIEGDSSLLTPDDYKYDNSPSTQRIIKLGIPQIRGPLMETILFGHEIGIEETAKTIEGKYIHKDLSVLT